MSENPLSYEDSKNFQMEWNRITGTLSNTWYYLYATFLCFQGHFVETPSKLFCIPIDELWQILKEYTVKF